jgi:SOS-response transcriptional repressor LexA
MKKNSRRSKPLNREQQADATRLERIFKERKRLHRHLTQESMAECAGWTQSNVSQYLKGKIALNLKAAIQFSKFLGVEVGEFSPTLAQQLLGVVPQVRGQAGALPRMAVGPTTDVLRGREVPLISWVNAGAHAEAADPYAVGDAEKTYPCPSAHGPRTFALRVRGVSMQNPAGNPTFFEKEVIFVDPDREAVHGSLVIAKMNNDHEVTFKQLLIEDGRHFLKALNPAWPDGIVELTEDSSIIGVVIAKHVEF